MDRTLLLLSLIITGVTCQACQTNSPVANMCQTGSVHGPMVTLDVTSGADGNFTSCSCFLQSNSSGFYFDFLSTPASPGCNAGLQLRFDDTSMQLLCGGLPGVQYTRGQSANIIYNMTDSTNAADSSYCLTFYNNDTDIDFQLSCYNPLSSSTPMPSTTLAINSTSLSFNVTSPTTTPLPNSSFPSSNITSTQSPITPWSNSTSPSANTTSTQSPITPLPNSSSASTTSSGSSTPLANITDRPTQSSTLSFVSTSRAPSSPGTPILPSPTTANITSTAQSTTNYTNNSTAATTEQTPMNTTLSMPVTSVQSSLSTPRQNITKSVLSSEETTTKSISNTTAPTGSTAEQNDSISSKSSVNSTSSPTTLQVFQNTTSADLNSNTTLAPTSYHNSTEDVFQQNTTITPEVTAASKVTKSFPSNNTSAAGGSSGNASLSTDVTDNLNITTTESTNSTSNNTAPPANTTEATFTTTHIPENSTDVFENGTVTTNGNSTTAGGNINTTETTGGKGVTGPTTEKLETTTDGWVPPDGGYSPPAKTNNLLVVLVPVLAVLLLVFLVVVTYVMCKRSRKASKQTKVPGKNTQGKKDMNANLNDKTNEQNSSSTVGKKSDNPADYFVAHQASTSIEKETYKEIKKDTETEKEHPNGRVKENHELSMAMKSLDSSLMGNGSGGKPKVYEPTEREKDILESLELSSIVIESDPNDPNRYFKKADPGDWYRIIMKGKKPKDQKSKSGQSKGSHRKSSQTDSSEGDADKTKRHRKKRESNGNEMNTKSRRSSKHRKRNSGYYSDPEQMVTLTQTGKLSKAYEALLQSGDFDNSPRANTFGSQTLPANYKMDNVTVDQTKQPESNVIVSKPLVIESKPKVVEPPRTRVIMSQSTSSAKQSTSNTMQDIAQQNNTPSVAIINSTPVQTKQTVTTQVQSSPARPRSNLFGSRSGSLKASEQQSDKDANAVKRPEIVPPLNLTGTGDQVEIDEDGLEGFVLNH